MIRRRPQHVSLLPIARTLAVFDAVIASSRGIRWDAQAARDRLVAAATDGFVETGVAKRILNDAMPSNTLPWGSIIGMARIARLWNGLKTISPIARDEQEDRWRRGLDRVIERTLSDGLVAIRYVSHPHFSGHRELTRDQCATIGVLSDAMHNLPAVLERKDRPLTDMEVSTIRHDVAIARRAIRAMISWQDPATAS